jgi:hypothetical protein
VMRKKNSGPTEIQKNSGATVIGDAAEQYR